MTGLENLTTEFRAALGRDDAPVPPRALEARALDVSRDFTVSRNVYIAETELRLRMLAAVLPDMTRRGGAEYRLPLPGPVAVGREGARILSTRREKWGLAAGWPLVFSYATLRRMPGMHAIVEMAREAGTGLEIRMTDALEASVPDTLAIAFRQRAAERYDVLHFRVNPHEKFSDAGFPSTLDRPPPRLTVVR